MSNRKHRNSSRVMKLVSDMLAQEGPLPKHEIRSRLGLYGGTVVKDGINYLLLNGKILEGSEGKLEIPKLENEK